MADTDATKTKKKRRFKRPKLLVGLGIIVVIIAIVVLWYRYNQSPAEGTINNQNTAGNTQTTQTVSTQTYSGKAVSFTYSSIYTNKQNGAPNGPIIEQMSFSGRIGSQESRKIGLTVVNIQPGAALKDDAAYKTRLANKADFTHTTAPVAGKTAEVFTRKDGTEITYMIPGNGKYAIITGTTTNPTGLLADDIGAVIKTFQWQ